MEALHYHAMLLPKDSDVQKVNFNFT